MSFVTHDALSLSQLQRDDVRANPYPFYELLREQDPIHWDEEMGFWTLTRYDDIASLYTDERFSRAEGLLRNFERLTDPQQQIAQPVYQSFSKTVFYSDPPYHTHLRSLMNHAFTPRYVERLRPYIQQTVDQLLDSHHGEMDVIHDLAYPLPVMVIAELIGLPASDRAKFKNWSDDLFAILGTVKNKPKHLLERAAQSLGEMTVYIKHLADKRRENMGDDLLSVLLSVSDGDSCPYPHHAATPFDKLRTTLLSQGQLTRESSTASTLTEEELVANVNILLSTGHETTTHLIGNGILALLQNLDQLKLLKERPALITSAIDEILRYDNPVQITYRSAIEDAELGGKFIRKGDLVNSIIASANRDPERFMEPHRFDITRNEGRHLGFGLGIHYCIGAPLVKLEAEIAFETLLRRFPNLQLKSDVLEWQEHPIFRGLKKLGVSL